MNVNWFIIDIHQRPEPLMNVNYEPIIRGLKSDIFEVKNLFHICRIQLQKKKSGVKKCLEICAIKGGGVGPLMANAILNFHFDFLTPSLRNTCSVYQRTASIS